MSSSRPPYRLLCLYRIREVVEKVRAETDREILARGGVPTRPVRVLPANELTRFYFPQFVGKKVGAFLDHVRSEYRLAIAHGNLDEYFKLVLDPADARIDHRIDFTNAALLPVGVLFGVAHMGNQNVTILAVVNTTAWGILLGYAYIRTRALWLSIGMHFGWNAAMPLFGINLSGFTIGVTGYGLRWRAGQVWSGGDYGLEGSILTTFVAVVVFFVVQRAIPEAVLERGE